MLPGGFELYGRVSAFGPYRVETMFAHLVHIPYIPMRSFLTADDGTQVPIGWDLRSIYAGLVRWWGLVFVIGAVFNLVTGQPGASRLGWAAWALVFGTATALAYSPWMKVASPSRAQRLLMRAGYPAA